MERKNRRVDVALRVAGVALAAYAGSMFGRMPPVSQAEAENASSGGTRCNCTNPTRVGSDLIGFTELDGTVDGPDFFHRQCICAPSEVVVPTPAPPQQRKGWFGLW